MVGSFFCLAAVATVETAQVDPKPVDGATDIVVTGERVPRTLSETPSSVHVIGEAEIEAAPVDRLEDVLAFVPNVRLGHGSEGPAIRGLDTTGALQALPAFLGGNRPRTTLVVDGRPTSYNEFIFGAAPLWDVARVEVFRSPQTTTQGQNSIAGAIFLHTNDPGFEPEYRARAIAGNYGTRQLSALASMPLTGDVAVRVAGDLRYNRTSTEIADRIEGADPNHDVYGQLRAKLLAEPAALPGTRILLTYAHLQSQAPQVLDVTQPFRERRNESGFFGTFRINVDTLTAAVQHESGDLVVNLLVTGGDSLARRLAFPGLGQSRNEGRDWSAEAVVNWTPDGALNVVGGASHRHVKLKQRIDLSVLSGIPHFRDWQDGTGIFGDARFKLSSRTSLSAGLRYQRDRQKRVGAFETATGAIALDYDRSFDAWLPKVSLSHDFSDSVSGGLLVQKAYNPGGTTLRFDIGRPDNFEAEKLWDYEAFVRASLAGGRLFVNANAFYYDMRNAQRAKPIAITAPIGLQVGFADLFNAPKARSYGIEAELTWRPNVRFSANFGLGLLRTRIVESAADYPEFEGNAFDRSPHLSAAAAMQWRATKRLLLSAQVRHHSGYWSDPENAPFTRVGSGTIADARGEYRVGRFALSAYVRNVFDSFSIISRDQISATLEDPREIGVGLEANF